MLPESDALLQAFLKLPESEQLVLVGRLLESLPAAASATSLDDPGLIEELERRFADSNETIPWSQLRSAG